MPPTMAGVQVGGQLRSEDYIGNLARLAVELVNAGSADGLTGPEAALLTEHCVTLPAATELNPLLDQLRPAMTAVALAADVEPINRLLRRYPTRLHISDHDGQPH